MKKAFFLSCALFLVMGSIAELPLSAQTVTLTGSVRTVGGDPLAARISILRGPPAAGIETHDTAADGTFSIETSSAGLQLVSASAHGYASREVDRSGDTPFPALNFVLAESQLIQGRVQDNTGTAQPGVNVRVRYIDAPKRLLLDDGLSATTDETGAFTLAAAVSGGGRFVVDALPDDWVPVSSSVLGTGAVAHTGAPDEDESDQSILVALQSRGSRVTGQVTSPSGETLANVLVRAVVKVQTLRTTEGDDPGPGTVVTPGGVERPLNELRKYVKTDSDGNYEMKGLPAGSLVVIAGRSGTSPQVQRFTSVEGGIVTANFVLLD